MQSARRVFVVRLPVPSGCENVVAQRDVSIVPSARTNDGCTSCLWRPPPRRMRLSLKRVKVIRPNLSSACESVVVQRDYTVIDSKKTLDSRITFSPRSLGRRRQLVPPVVVVRQPLPLGCETVVAQRNYAIVGSVESHGPSHTVFAPKYTRQKQHSAAEV
jgi:hypothetical protein